MTVAEYSVKAEGLEEATRLLERYPEISRDVMVNRMGRSVKTLSGNIKLEMHRPVTRGVSGAPGMPINQGRLVGAIGGFVEVAGSVIGPGAVTVTGEVNAGDVAYALPVELGRRPGTWVPIEPLKRWAHLKLGDARAAYAIRASIFKRGIKGYFMFARGWLRSRESVRQEFRHAIREIVERLARGKR